MTTNRTAGPVHKLSDVTYGPGGLYDHLRRLSCASPTYLDDRPPRPTFTLVRDPVRFMTRPRRLRDFRPHKITRGINVKLSGADPSPTAERVIYIIHEHIQGACVRLVIFLMMFRHDRRIWDCTTTSTVRATIRLLIVYKGVECDKYRILEL